MGDQNRRFHNSFESQTQKISKSVFVTNFLDTTTARDLWMTCSAYGTVVDVFIPFKRSKARKKFAFVRFIMVTNHDRLVENLCTIWIGRFHLYANLVRFDRPQKPNSTSFKETTPVAHKISFASVLKEDHVVNSDSALVLDESCIIERHLNLSLMGKVKEVSAIPNLPVMITKEGFQNVKFNYLGGLWILFEFESISIKDKFLAHTGVGSWFSTIKQADNSFVNDERIVWVSVEGLPIKAWTPNSFRKIVSCWGELVDWEESEQNSLSCKHLCLKTKMNVIINDTRKIIVQGKVFWIRVKELDAWVPDFEEDNSDDLSSDEEEPKANNNINIDDTSDADRVSESSFVQEMDHVIDSLPVDSTHSKTGEDNLGEDELQSEDPFNIYDLLNKKNKKNNSTCNSGSEEPKFPPGFTPSTTEQELIREDKLQGSTESLGNKAKRRWVNELCHKHKINFVSLQETKAENIDLCSIQELWGNLFFDHVVGSSVGCSGTWTPTSSKLLIISVYAPQELSEKRELWEYLHCIINRWDGETVIMGDFNEVHLERERFGSIVNQQGYTAFNNFISRWV
ncbi:RNA-directed DNA polymerase, eukaryota [Tanacetum coccineum]